MLTRRQTIGSNLFIHPLRRLSSVFQLLVASFIIFVVISFFVPGLPPVFLRLPRIFSPQMQPICTPGAYADGQWQYKPRTKQTMMNKEEDALAFAGFTGCASSREYYWHLAADKEDHWARFPNASSWEWTPNGNCSLRDLNAAEIVRDLVERGGWLLLGDSISEGHFFSLSCMLYPHVIATPDYKQNPNFDRGWPQNLYLNPKSSLIPSISLPRGFRISETPLVTFRRVDLLLSKNDLISLHRTIADPPANFSLFSDELVWSMGPNDYMDIFTAPLPQGNYNTMVVSTGGHWTTTLFSGFQNASKAGAGIDDVVDFFGRAMDNWAEVVQHALDTDRRRSNVRPGGGPWKGQRQVVVRAYLPGHEDCHNFRQPWTEIAPFVWNWYNWGQIWRFNQVFEEVVSKYSDIHYLAIDRPARLRPDAHATGDCLHIMAGAGVLEGWTHYIWHFVTRELGTRTRSV